MRIVGDLASAAHLRGADAPRHRDRRRQHQSAVRVAERLQRDRCRLKALRPYVHVHGERIAMTTPAATEYV